MSALTVQKAFPVAFCADPTMETPLHAAALSVLQSLTGEGLAKFYFLLTGFSPGRIDRLRRTLDSAGRNYEMHLLALPNASLFKGFRPLHGSLMPYYRLALPELVDEKRLLYLDADTLTLVDISPLFSVDMEGHATGFVVDGIMQTCLERDFFLSCGLRRDGQTFNSGVMLFDLPQWRQQRCFERCLEFGRLHSAKLQTADQTILNALFSDDTFHLPPRYNEKMYPHTRLPAVALPAIYHFAGSPKPWDIGGRFMHEAYWLWRKAADSAAVGSNPYLDLKAWTRAAHILPSYPRSMRARRQNRG